MRADHKYFYIVEQPQKGKRKTRDYDIINTKSSVIIGTLEYNVGWRQHVFVTNENCIWSSGCLKDVCEFLDELKIHHQKKRENKNE